VPHIIVFLCQLGDLLGPSQAVRKQVERLENYLKGVDEGVRQRREDTCLASLMDSLGFMVGRYFVLEAFPGNSKTHAEGIIGGVIDAFHERLLNLDWLDEPTRAKAQEKVLYNAGRGLPAAFIPIRGRADRKVPAGVFHNPQNRLSDDARRV
jgi:Peptidase family M13